MTGWFYVRVAIIGLVGASAILVPLRPVAVPPMGWGSLVAIFLIAPLMLLFVMGLQSANPWSGKIWHQPSWFLNPFAFSQPAQFFHLGAYAAIVYGMVVLVRMAISVTLFYVEVLVPLAVGGGLLLGISLCKIAFSSKFTSGT